MPQTATHAAPMPSNWRKFRDEDFPAGDLDARHVVPLFLGGADDLRFNGTALRRSLHQTGHQVLNLQPQIGALNPALGPHLLKHPPGTRYRLAGDKEGGRLMWMNDARANSRANTARLPHGAAPRCVRDRSSD